MKLYTLSWKALASEERTGTKGADTSSSELSSFSSMVSRMFHPFGNSPRSWYASAFSMARINEGKNVNVTIHIIGEDIALVTLKYVL